MPRRPTPRRQLVKKSTALVPVPTAPPPRDADLYQILGVGRRASAAELKRAFTEYSRRFHPDRGGDPAVFERGHLAYRVLVDPVRRRRYDDTGEVDDPLRVKVDHGKIFETLLGCFAHVLDQVLKENQDPERVDLAAILREAMSNAVANKRRALEDARKGRRALAKTARRFRKKSDGAELLERMVWQKLLDQDALVDFLARDLARMEGTLAFLEDVGYDYTRETLRGYGTTVTWSPA